MKKGSIRERTIFICTVFMIIILVLPTIASATNVAGEKEVIRLTFTDPPTLKIGDMNMYHPSYAAMLAFKGSFEKSTGGKYTVELYPNGVLGDAASTLEQLISGTLEGSTPADGALAPFYDNIQVFSIPYLFSNPTVAYDVLDGEFGQNFFEDMASKSGLRVVASYDNGGYRNFTNSKREIRTADDMAGLNIRVMESPVYLNLVKSLGASATPVAFLELYSALQTGVVDGQENSAITTLGASLNEVQRYCTLDGHLLGLAFLTISEDWYQSLDNETQKLVDIAGREASIAARGTCRYAESVAISTLSEKGIQVYSPTPEELETFKVSQKPVIEYLEKEIDAKLVEEIFIAIENVEKGVVSKGSSDTNKLDADKLKDETPAGTKGSSTNLVLISIIAILAVVIAFIMSRKRKEPHK